MTATTTKAKTETKPEPETITCLGKVYKVHPFAATYDIMPDGDLQDMADSIKQNGLDKPVEIYRDQVADGRNRLRACDRGGVEPKFKVLSDDFIEQQGGIKAYIRKQNEQRRHESAEVRKARREDLRQKAVELRKDGSTLKQVADKLGVPLPTVQRWTEGVLSTDKTAVGKDGKSYPTRKKAKGKKPKVMAALGDWFKAAKRFGDLKTAKSYFEIEVNYLEGSARGDKAIARVKEQLQALAKLTQSLLAAL